MRDTSLVDDMILVCSRAVGIESAQKGIRALCRYFGGQLIYVPLRDHAGVSAQKIYRVIEEATSDTAAMAMLEKIVYRYGGLQLYIPFERSAFRKVVALEIFERYGTGGYAMSDLTREYGISFTHAYALWREGRREKYTRTLPYQPYLEFDQ